MVLWVTSSLLSSPPPTGINRSPHKLKYSNPLLPQTLAKRLPSTMMIRAPVYDETVEVEETPTTHVPTPIPVATPPPNILPLAPPVLVRQRAVAISPLADRRFREDDFPIRTLFGEDIPLGEPLEPFPVATAAPAVRTPAFGPPGGFGQAPVMPGWANGQPPFEPHDRNNPINPNRYYIG